MNRNKLKSYTPKARRDFIKAVTDRAAYYGLTKKQVEPIIEEGDVAIIGGRPFPKAVAEKRKKVDDETELLIPDNLLHSDSLVRKPVNEIPEEDWQDVEIIGWLYQFYISEKKDEVFEGLKINKKITPENIPAATQLFTPHWIVRYLVENSLGRLWMLNRPHSRLINKLEYYI